MFGQRDRDRDRERQLSTADLARTEKMRGTSDEQVRAREDRPMVDAPAAARPAGVEPERTPQREPSPVQHDAVQRHPQERTSMVAPRTDAVAGQARTALFSENDARALHERWMDVQGGFVDEPRAAVERADALVAEAMQALAESFARERAALEHQWDRGGNVTTEDLRVTLQRYRSFFERLLKV